MTAGSYDTEAMNTLAGNLNASAQRLLDVFDALAAVSSTELPEPVSMIVQEP